MAPALVTDDQGNPVEDGVQVDWTGATPASATSVVTPAFTNGEPPCDTSPYDGIPNGQALTITPQPGTAITCFIYDDERGGDPASVTANVNGTDLEVTTRNFVLPSFPPEPTPTPAPAQPTPAPTQTPGPPAITPLTANLSVGNSQVFAVSGGSAAVHGGGERWQRDADDGAFVGRCLHLHRRGSGCLHGHRVRLERLGGQRDGHQRSLSCGSGRSGGGGGWHRACPA